MAPPRREWLHLAAPLLEFADGCIRLLLPSLPRQACRETGHDHWFKPVLEFAFVFSLSTYALLTLRLTRRL